MNFASPAWLIALAPWAGIGIWLLWGRREKASVPFLSLWQGAAQQHPPRQGWRMPPASLALIWAAVLLAILAAADFQLPAASSSSNLTVIVDRGLSMSARGQKDLHTGKRRGKPHKS